MNKKIWLMLISFFILVSTVPGWAEVRWQMQNSLKLEYTPVDTQMSLDGEWLYILDDQQHLLVYATNGSLKDTLDLGHDYDHITVTPKEDLLFLTSRATKTVQIIRLDYIKDINIDGSPFKGPENAPVTLVEFTDFQCPYCARLAPVLDQVHALYPKKVKLVLKNYPLRSHKFALKAAMAALAAEGQGKFWEFHDRLFENYHNLNLEKIEEIRQELSLDKKAFDQRMAAPETLTAIQTDMKDGREAGVRGTPTLFLNGAKVTDRSLEGLKAAIEAELNRLAAKPQG